MPPRTRRRITTHRCRQCGTYTTSSGNCRVCSRRALNRPLHPNTSSPSTPNAQPFQVPVPSPLRSVSHCECCMRSPTVAFPFDCHHHISANLVSRHYGAVNRHSLAKPTLRLCGLCYRYLSPGPLPHSGHAKWAIAWPSVLCTYLFSTPPTADALLFVQCLPRRLRQLWQPMFNSLSIAIQRYWDTPPALVDITSQRSEYLADVESNEIHRIITCNDALPCDTIRCLYGCFAHPSDCGSIGFQHVIGLVDPNFHFADSNPDKSLRGRRPDWLESRMFLNTWVVAPSTFIPHERDVGLQLATCAEHDGGGCKEYCHVPQNPTGHLCSPWDDQLSHAVFVSRKLLPARKAFNSHAWSLTSMQGGYQGLSSFFLSTERRFDIHDPDITYPQECLAVAYRPDIRALLFQILADDVIHLLNEAAVAGDSAAIALQRTVFANLNDPSIWRRFINDDPQNRQARIPVFPFPRVADSAAFIIHLILSMGRYDCEPQIFAVPTLLAAMQVAGLAPIDREANTADVYNLVKQYILMQARWMPGGVRSFDRNIIKATSILSSLLLRGELAHEGTPLVLTRSLQALHTESSEHLLQDIRRNLATVLHDSVPGAPSVEAIVNSTLSQPLQWRPMLSQAPYQSPASLYEQQEALDQLCTTIDCFASGLYSFTRGHVCAGSAGSGKTHLLLTGTMYCRARGLETVMTALSSERASELGGFHLHRLVPLPIFSRNRQCDVRVSAERCIVNLSYKPDLLLTLRRIDVWCIDEIGLISAETFSILDLVLQHVKDNTLPFGGCLVLGTGDMLQLNPSTGRPLWVSPHVLTTFTVIPLKHMVRAAGDGNLMRCLDILRQPFITDENLLQITDLIEENCRFVPTFADVPFNTGTIRLFSRKIAEREEAARLARMIELDESITSVHHIAVDEVTTNLGGAAIWRIATESESTAITAHVQEPYDLRLYDGCIIRFTRNHKSRSFSNGQLGVIRRAEAPVTVYVAPCGARSVPDISYVRTHWTLLTVSPMVSPVLPLRRHGYGRRQQLPLKVYVSSTIHRALGSTMSQIACRFSQTDPRFRLWDRRLLYVALSRVRSLGHIVFVGPRQDTFHCITEVARRRGQFDDYIHHLLSVVEGAPNLGSPQIDLTLLPIMPLDCELPHTPTGFVYALISMRTREVYVGQTSDVDKRLRQHNSSRGSVFTRALHRQPFALLALMHGFNPELRGDHLVAARERIEASWKSRLRSLQRLAQAADVLDTGSLLAHENDLVFVVCSRV
ncbi:hypothetical protein FOZ60_001490 [Perkinsus olseni]|uniref:ATP-dependent DNA helicase n=1 Tax=Perkinsus olseni TaxID=32597 RepID=A0A7J6P0D9_PEROL|nr:hypothetical protein FOZ60_001490 [Perkinsus olseni]